MKRFFTLLVPVFLLFISTCLFSAKAEDDLFQITVIDVGKGDCILVQTGDHTVMIDTGYQSTADTVLQYLEEHKITALDAMIISHFHKDHVGGAAAILDVIPVNNIYLPDYEGSRDVYQDMLVVIRNKGITTNIVPDPLSFQMGNAVYDLYPSSAVYDPEAENDNDVSLSASLKFMEHSAFFSGDIEEAGITSLLNYAHDNGLDLTSYILKLPHHGRTSDNSAELLDLISPKIALITDGSSQRVYGDMTDMLDERNITYLSSAADGTYIIKAAGTSDYSFEKSNQTEYQTSGPWLYTVSEDGTASIAGYTGKDKELTIPSVIDGHTVSEIAPSAFFNQTKLTSVTVPDSVTGIGDSAFAWCTKLKNISLPNTLQSLGAGAFSYCEKLENIDLPDGISTIGEYTFFHCKKLAEITIPDGVETIGEKAFSHCNALEQITIPSGVKKMEEDAFKKCKRLRTAVILSGLKTIKKSMFEDCESLESVTIPESVISIKSSVFKGCVTLAEIFYGGSEKMWDAVEKGKEWDLQTPADKVIHFAQQPSDDPDADGSPDNNFFPSEGFAVLPATGIASPVIPHQPKDLKYEDTGITISIPSVSSYAKILETPLADDEYPVTWLGKNAGLPEGFARPGEGTSVIVGHNHLDRMESGPFALLKFVEIGDRIFIRNDDGDLEIFSVFANEKISMTDLAVLKEISLSKKNTLILLTCEDERPDGLYENRRIVAAEPVS